MKRHSGWLAAGLLLFAVLACNLSKNTNNLNGSNNSNNSNSANKNSNSANKNSNSTVTRPANADVYVNKLTMNKDNNGKPGATTTTFEPGDHTIQCVAELNKAKAGTQVRFVWKAVDVPGEKNEDIKTIDYTTRSFENKVFGHLTLPSDWPKGTYAVDVFINEALDKTIQYTIE